MKFVSRSEWGAKYGRGPTNITPGKGGVTVHYEGGGKLTGAAHSKCAQRVRNIESYHVNHNGWQGIAYTLLVCEHGYVFEGRGLGHRTAANGTNSGNQNWYAVCAMIGDKDPAGDALLHGMRDAIDYLRRNGAGSKINGHRDHLSTSCPGSALYAWVKKGAPRPGSTPAPSPGGGSDWMEAMVKKLPTLKRGAKGEHVETLQGLLQARSHPEVKIDGDFGPKTEAAVKAVQKWGGTAADGIVGPKTWPVLLRVHK